ncbi:MAG: UvrD-helicase domain-containing protein, partial [Gammaproteobacteria bacterium]
LAGAGSGKTSVITRKIAWLIETVQYDPSKIVAVTFTNKAAREMRARAAKLIRGDSKGLAISTFHTLGLNIIRAEHKALGLRNGFTIFDAEDARVLIRELMQRDENADAKIADATQQAISALKNDMLSPDDALAAAKSPREMMIARVYEGYERNLRAYNAVDFDDLILKPVQVFAAHGEILEKWQNRTRYLLVDEYQDTNLSQYRLVKQLVGVRGALTVVGDDDQSIYAWRGARPENLVQLKEDFPGLKVVALEQNYRSTGRILRAANTVIANNVHVFEKKLWSEHGPGEPIRIVCCKDEQAEAERIATEIVSHRARTLGKWKDYAVLYRGNFQSRLIEEKLRERQVPYKVSGGTSFFARAEIKDLMSYLRLVANPDDDSAFLRVVNVPRREIGPTTLEKLAQYAGTRHVSLSVAAGEIGLGEHVGTAHREKVSRFVHWLADIRRRLHQLPAKQALNELLDEIGYQAWLHAQSNTPQAAMKRWENVQSLIESIHTMSEKEDDHGQRPDIGEVIAKLVLLDMLDQQEENDDTDRVQLMTLHASKGLEFPHVWIMAFEEDVLPHRNSIEADTIEEERRLLYVGITRARRTLTLTWARQRKQFGDMQSCTPSRFMEELPRDDITMEGEGTVATAEQKAQSRDNALAALDALLKR